MCKSFNFYSDFQQILLLGWKQIGNINVEFVALHLVKGDSMKVDLKSDLNAFGDNKPEYDMKDANNTSDAENLVEGKHINFLV